MEELCDENMNFQHVCDVLALDVAQNVNEPFKVFMRWADPKEVDLFTRHS